MDSMRHLSTSLPRASSRRSDAPPDLLSDFKAAALSVTNLFKTAASAQSRSRAAGYQDALDDLLAFLDKENLGLMDGEGWRVRQWATERLEDDGSTAKQAGGSGTIGTDDEEETATIREEDKEDDRSSSPDLQRKDKTAEESNPLAEEETPRHRRVVSEPPHVQTQPQPQIQHLPPTGDFTFQTSGSAYPQSHDREGSSNGMDVDIVNSPGALSTGNDAVRILPRTGRNSRSSKRHESRQASLNITLGAGASNKRKIPYPDFFDISGFNDGFERKDGSGSGRQGKRGRHS